MFGCEEVSIIVRDWFGRLVIDMPSDIEFPTTVIWPIFLAGFDSFPYICSAALGIAIARFISSLWESFDAPPRIFSIIVAGNIAGIAARVNDGIIPSIERSCDLYCENVGHASIV